MSPTYYYGSGDPKQRFQHFLDNPPPAIALDVETISLKERMPLGFAIAFSPEEAIYFQVHPEPPPELELLRPLLNNPDVCKIAHNAMFDLGVMPMIPHCADMDRSNLWDTNVAARLLGKIETSLGSLADIDLNRFDVEDAASLIKRHKVGGTMLDVPAEETAAKCQKDAKVAYALYDKYKPEIDSRYYEYFKVEMAVIPILIELSMRGLKIDQDARAELEAKYEEDVEFYRKLVLSYGVDKPGSPQQIGYMLAKRGNFLPMTKSRKQLSTDVKNLEFLSDPMAAAVLGWRGKNKFLGTYLKPLAGEDRFYTSYFMDTSVGRLNSRDRNIQNVPLEARRMLLPDNRMFTSGDYCLHPDTKILNADLTWTCIKDAKVGDELVGIEEYPVGGKGKRRKLLRSCVNAVSTVKRQSFIIVLSDGRYIVASGEHPWLIMDSIKHNSVAQYPAWEVTRNISAGTKIRQMCKPWKTDFSYDAAYLAGFVDGEGWIDSSYHAVGFAQNPGSTLDRVVAKTHRLGFYPTRCTGSSSTTVQYKFTQMSEMLRFVGTIRPERLLEKSTALWEGYEPPKLDAWVEVIALYPVGEQELISIGTSSSTFVAEGLFTHNSQEHPRILAYVSQDREMLRVFDRNQDIHLNTARELGVPRDLAKRVNNAMHGGATARTVSIHTKIKDLGKCNRFIDDWSRVYKSAADWIRYAQEEGFRTGWSLPTLFGRKIRIANENEDAMRRKGSSYPILGSDGEVIKRAILICDSRGLGPPVMAATVHDSITFDGDVQLPVEELEQIPGFHIPIEVKQTWSWE